MIDDAAQLRDFDPDRLVNLVELIGPWPAGAILPGPPGLLVLRRGRSVLTAIHSRSGAVALEEVGGDLGGLARRHGARWVIVADHGAVTDAVEAASGRLAPGADLVDVGLELGRALGEARRRGGLDLWPDLLDGLRLPRRRELERAFDLLLPPASSALLYVFDRDRLYAEAICVRGDRAIELLAGHDALESGPPPAARWREQHGRILEAAARRLRPPSLGVFVELSVARAAARGELGAAELSRALARRDLVLDPLPAWLAAPLGLVAFQGAVEAGRRAGAGLARRLGPAGLGERLAGRVGGALASRLRGSPMAGRVGQSLAEVGRRADLADLLGFDLFALAARLLELARGELPEPPPGS